MPIIQAGSIVQLIMFSFYVDLIFFRYFYSVRIDFTGLAKAALMDLYPTAIHAINIDINIDTINISGEICILNTKFCSQLFIR